MICSRLGGLDRFGIILTWLLVVMEGVFPGRGISEKAVQEYILTDYNPEVKPIGRNGSDQLDIFFDMRITKVSGLDFKNQILSMNTFTMLRWTDDNLQWNSTKFNGTDVVTMASTLIWTPDVILYNDEEDEIKTHSEVYRSKVSITSDGNVRWVSPVKWKAGCQVDVTWFPVDKQICNMTFGSFSYNYHQLKLKFWSKQSSREKVLSSGRFQITSGEWSLKKMVSYEEKKDFTCCDKPFALITYEIHMHRLPLYYFLYLIFPMLTQLLLFLVTFHLPADLGERMGFGVTILLNITLYLVMLSEKLPEKSDKASVLGLCFITLFTLLSLGLGLSAVNVIYSRKVTTPPRLLIKYICKDSKDENKNPYKTEFNIQGEINSIVDHDEQEIIQMRNISTSSDASPRQKSIVDLDSNEQWERITKFFDNALCVAMGALVILLPIIICLSFDTEKMGGF